MPRPLMQRCHVCNLKKDLVNLRLIAGSYVCRNCFRERCPNCGAPVQYRTGEQQLSRAPEYVFMSADYTKPCTGRCADCGAPTVPSDDPDEAAYGEVKFAGFDEAAS